MICWINNFSAIVAKIQFEWHGLSGTQQKIDLLAYNPILVFLFQEVSEIIKVLKSALFIFIF